MHSVHTQNLKPEEEDEILSQSDEVDFHNFRGGSKLSKFSNEAAERGNGAGGLNERRFSFTDSIFSISLNDMMFINSLLIYTLVS